MRQEILTTDTHADLCQLLLKHDIVTIQLEGEDAGTLWNEYDLDAENLPPDLADFPPAQQFVSRRSEVPRSKIIVFDVLLDWGLADGKLRDGTGCQIPQLILLGVTRQGNGYQVSKSAGDQYYLSDNRNNIFDRYYNSQHRHSYVEDTARVLMRIFGTDWFISKVAVQLRESYRTTLSVGQARAVIFRALGMRLSSTERSHLHELRRKIRKYRRLVTDFEEYVLVAPQQRRTLSGDESETQDLGYVVELGTKPLTMRSELQAALKQGESYFEHVEAPQASTAPIYNLRCGRCGETREIPQKVLDSSDDETIPLPEHCGEPMKIYISHSQQR